MRQNSPSIEVLGKSIKDLPSEGSSFRINHDNLAYTLTMKSGEVIVTGGEEGKLTAYFETLTQSQLTQQLSLVQVL